jgi:hypothetical protein
VLAFFLKLCQRSNLIFAMTDEDLLYDDLKNDVFPLKPTPGGASAALSLVSHSKALEERVRQLEEENENLKRNIGTLFRTAKAEILRKDAEIASLTHQLEDLNNRR